MMLRERRRVLNKNIKPNRRLDKKSSRGMVFENEELRLRTINISADVERGQSDIRKLRRENELLRREIWTLRDEYDRLDKILQDHPHTPKENKNKIDTKKEIDDVDNINYDSEFTSDDDSEDSCESCSEYTKFETKDENIENRQEQISPDIETSNYNCIKHNVSFNIEATGSEEYLSSSQTSSEPNTVIELDTITPRSTVWTDNKLVQNEMNNQNNSKYQACSSLQSSSNQSLNSKSLFQTGGNLEDLLIDIENLSRDIYNLQMQNRNKISSSQDKVNLQPDILTASVSVASLNESNGKKIKKPFRSEVSLVLAQPGISTVANSFAQNKAIGFENIQNQVSFENIQNQVLMESQQSSNNASDEKKSHKTIQLITTPNNIRKQFIKTPSASLNELTSNSKINEHSQENLEKRLSLDNSALDSNKFKLNENHLNENSEKFHKEHKEHKKHKQEDAIKLDSKSSKGVSLFFRKRKPEKEKRNSFYDEYASPITTLPNQKFSNRKLGNKKLFNKDPSSNFRLKKSTEKSVLVYQDYKKKYSRLNADENNSHANHRPSIVEHTLSVSDKNSEESDASSVDSMESFRSRKFSISSNGKQNSEKIPWCACWGNGCY